MESDQLKLATVLEYFPSTVVQTSLDVRPPDFDSSEEAKISSPFLK